MIFLIFLKLGCYSFGGPAAHLSYFHEEFVRRKQWLRESDLSEIIALTQLLPGPGSSQTGFLIGVMRGGLWGGLQAWLGFTLPSALLLTLVAAGVSLTRNTWTYAAMRGLQLASIAVLANAVRLMHRQLSPDLPRSILAGLTAIFVLLVPIPVAQLLVIVGAGIAGALWLKRVSSTSSTQLRLPISKTAAVIALSLFALFFLSLEILSRITSLTSIRILQAFYQSGALVFGGGHVVLPLLQTALVRPGWISEPDFLTGYGAAQTVPGPLFTFAAYLGFLLPVHSYKAMSALACLVMLFLPGILLVIGIVPYWQFVREQPRARAAIAGINASVVGLLAAALIKIVAATPLSNPFSICLVIFDLALLWFSRTPPFVVVVGSVAAMAMANVALC